VGVAPVAINIDVEVLAAVRSYRPDELVGDIRQTDSLAIISPTPIGRAQWPGGELPTAGVADPSLPRKGDKLVVAGRVRSIEFVAPIYIAGELVRIELRILG